MTKLTVKTIIHAPLAIVRDMRNNPEHIVHRCFASDDRCCPRATNDLRVGGILCVRMEAKDGSFGFDMTGQYDVVEPMSRIQYTMGSYEKDTDFVPAGRAVEITFVQTEAGVVVTEIFDAEEIHDLEMQTTGWKAILENCKKYAEQQV